MKPIIIPDLVFILSDNATAPFAVRIAEAIDKKLDGNLVIDDFLSPIHNSLCELLIWPWSKSYGDPANTGDVEPMSKTKATRQQLIDSLAQWVSDQFGPDYFGVSSCSGWEETRVMSDVPFVFRDAKPEYIRPFLVNTHPTKMVFIILTGEAKDLPPHRVIHLTSIDPDTFNYDGLIAALESLA